MMCRYRNDFRIRRKQNGKFGWGTKSGEDLVPLCDGLKLLKETSLNEIMKRYSVRGNLHVANKLNNRIAVFSLKGNYALDTEIRRKLLK